MTQRADIETRDVSRDRHPDTYSVLPPSVVLDTSPLTTASESVEAIYLAYDDAATKVTDLLQPYYMQQVTDPQALAHIISSLEPYAPLMRQYTAILDQLRTHVASAIDAMRVQLDNIEEALSDRIDQLDGSEFSDPETFAAEIEADIEDIRNFIADQAQE